MDTKAEKAIDEDMKTLWSGRFQEVPTETVQSFGASLPVDRRLWSQDIFGSLAHAEMLRQQGILDARDFDAIRQGLNDIGDDIAAGRFKWDIADEDIHMAIESELTRRIGEAGKKLHTGRSRNDQVAGDLRLWARECAHELIELIEALQNTLAARANEHFGVVTAGYTHLQKAQPILLSHHLLAYAEMFARDCERMRHAYRSADVSVLGSAALAGTTYPLNRQMTAEALGFSQVGKNSLDGVSDRDFALDLIYACSVCQMHMSRLCEELILFSTEEFAFVTFSDAYSTGSSIMPQKKNPDFAELIRGKTGRVYGDLVTLLTVMKGLPLAYNKDMQEDKEPLFDAVDTLKESAHVLKGILQTLTFNVDTLREAAQGGFMAATDLADYLVGKGMAFRDAHEVVGRIVLACEKEGRTLQDLNVEEYHDLCNLFDADVVDSIDIDKVVARRLTEGGTGHQVVRTRLDALLEK